MSSQMLTLNSTEISMRDKLKRNSAIRLERNKLSIMKCETMKNRGKTKNKKKNDSID